MEAITMKVSGLLNLTDDALMQLALLNKDLQLEKNCHGELIIMTPTGGGTGFKNMRISARLFSWYEQSKLGIVFDSSTGFKLPNGAVRSADAAWVSDERWTALTIEEQEQFPPLCPDFIIELMSKTDRLQPAQEKMAEWMANGCRLGWLIDRKDEQIYIYRADGSTGVLPSFEGVASGEDILPGFELDLRELR